MKIRNFPVKISLLGVPRIGLMPGKDQVRWTLRLRRWPPAIIGL